MRRFLFTLLAAGCLPGSLRAQQVTPMPLKVMTFNLRYNHPEDGANAWPHREKMVAAVFTEQEVDIAGLQEALAGMIADLQRSLPEYDFIGVGREDGQQTGSARRTGMRSSTTSSSGRGSTWGVTRF